MVLNFFSFFFFLGLDSWVGDHFLFTLDYFALSTYHIKNIYSIKLFIYFSGLSSETKVPMSIRLSDNRPFNFFKLA
jgi:hypothetical protein